MTKKVNGRPTKYSEELAHEIMERIATGESVRSVTNDEAMPSRFTFFLWMKQHESFSNQYAIAKQCAAEAIAEEMFDIADDGSNDWMEKLDQEGNNIGYKLNGENVQRSKLRVDTRKWYLSKIMPKKYGDTVVDDMAGESPSLNITFDVAEPKKEIRVTKGEKK